MALDYETALQVTAKDAPARYGREQAILYALGLGFGRDPMDVAELRFVYERGLVAVPTIATSLANAANGAFSQLGINMQMLVHGEQGIRFHRPMPPEADTLVTSGVYDIYDKGEGKGAVIIMETAIRERESGELMATLTSSLFARGDGGFMKPGQTSRTEQPRAHILPDRAPDLVDEFQTRPDQALLYRLSGDFNPLHADPAFAARAGFDRPILHGLCTYGVCGRAILKSVLDYDVVRMESIHARFSGPVIPGETIVTEMWVDGSEISFRASVKERSSPAVGNGLCKILGQRA